MPASTVIVAFAVTDVIGNAFPRNGTAPAELLVNVMPPAAIITASPTLKLCVPIVSTNTPVAGAYVAPVGVYCVAAAILAVMYAPASFCMYALLEFNKLYAFGKRLSVAPMPGLNT